MNEVRSILLVGVGGQGTILVSKLLTQGLIRAGYDVKIQLSVDGDGVVLLVVTEISRTI